jgi:hypothetical protein
MATTQTVGAFVVISPVNPSTCSIGQLYWNSTTSQFLICSAADTLQAISSSLSGVTGSIGGGALLLGGCASGTATIAGATVGQVVLASASDGTVLGGSFQVQASVTSSNTVTVNVCAVLAGTPSAKTYNVRVIS